MTSTSYGMTTTSATSTDDDTSTTDDIADDTKKSTSTTEQSTNMTTKPRCGSENDKGKSCGHGTGVGKLSTQSRCRNCGWLVLLFLLPLLYAAWRYRHKIRIWIRRYYKPSNDPEANYSPSAASSQDASKNTAATQQQKDDPKNAVAGTHNNPAYEENEVGKVNDKTKENKKNSVDEQTNNNDDKRDSKSDQRNNTKKESNNGKEENSKQKEGTFKTAAIQKAAANDSGKNRKHSGNRKSGTGQGKLKTLPD
ncbi:uncharacterized protein [Amphiura filiformis]|uniref:uncharacterized protein n=1 Tax=Amphiura filiformis TaxID=82378 RepID=UPI003B216366